ncbi:hypothetical protein [Thermomonospora amylolytica]|uniref:hypothetical protein n=1 Tax=Thermomonospora amylolytica TaxID=1411117 RepID=UPI000E6D4A0D|nr:hypothetical protein [Thermomonospora amylolytica]
MAPTRIAAAEAASSGAVGSQAVTIPAAVQAGDELLLVAVFGASGAYAPLSGWAPLADFNVTSASCRVGVWRRTAQAGDASSQVAPALATGTGVAAVQVIVHRDVDADTPLDVTPAAGDSGGATAQAVTAPAVTTATGEAAIVTVHALPTTTGTQLAEADWTPPAGATDELVTCSTSGTLNNACVATYSHAAAAAGQYGPFTATQTQTRRWGAVTVALRAATEEPPPSGGAVGGWGWIPAGS